MNGNKKGSVSESVILLIEESPASEPFIKI